MKHYSGRIAVIQGKIGFIFLCTAETNEVCRLETIITFVNPTIEKLHFDENDSKALL